MAAHNFVDFTGNVFGRWIVLRRDTSRKKAFAIWLCRCVCGNIRSVPARNLITGKSRSCGCLRTEILIKRFTTHGMTKSSEYKIWHGMKKRCEDPSSISYPRYGGRGIRICKRWQRFERFYGDMGPRPSTEHSIDRINPAGNYSPKNCRWATPQEQSENRRNTYKIGSEKLTLKEACRRNQIRYKAVHHRISRGWDIANALSTPVRKLIRKKDYRPSVRAKD